MTPTSEIVKRLREQPAFMSAYELAEAATRLEEQEREIERLREVLKSGHDILNTIPMAVRFADDREKYDALSGWVDAARAALDKKEG